MRIKLPTPAEGIAGLDRLAAEFGVNATQAFLRWARDARTSEVTEFLQLDASYQTGEVAVARGIEWAEARSIVADDWGYEGDNRWNFYSTATKGRELSWTRATPGPAPARWKRRNVLPGPKDGVDGLFWFADRYGHKEFQAFMRWTRDNKDPQTTAWLHIAGVRAIEKVMQDNPAMDFNAARAYVAAQWGYIGNNKSNFYRSVKHGQQLLAGMAAPAAT